MMMILHEAEALPTDEAAALLTEEAPGGSSSIAH
jgi:hypothetical protein